MKYKFSPFDILILVAAVIIFFIIIVHMPPKKPIAAPVTVSLPGVTVQDVPKITAALAPTIVKDPADQKLITALLAENAKYKLQVTDLVASQGQSVTHGELQVSHPVVEGKPAIGLQAAEPQPFEASDFRLHVTSDGKDLNYTLTQNFLVLNTTGRDKAGQRIADVKLFEVGPGETRTAIPVTSTEVTLDETVPHWLTGFNVQAGVVANADHATGYLAALQWLKRGRANNPKDLKWAALSPAVFFAPNAHSLGLLPVSANVANLIPHQPLTNVWVSLFLGADLAHPGQVNRVGVALTGTF